MPKYFSIFLVALTLSAYSQESSLDFNTDIGLFNSSIDAQLLSQSYGFLDEIEKSNIIDALKVENRILGVLSNLQIPPSTLGVY